uniref:Uncharacterized protein n=1 Tax=Oryza barthii TaxID=65489 RepID=A0A0D3HNW3_9ORYZ
MADGLTKYYLCCNIYASRLALCYNDLVHFCNRGSMSNVSFSKRCKDRVHNTAQNLNCPIVTVGVFDAACCSLQLRQ